MSIKNPLTPAGIEPATFRFVAQHLNHCATAVPFILFLTWIRRREWRRLHNEELNDLYCPSDIIRVIKTRMRWVGHVARMNDRTDLRETDHLEGVRVEDNIKIDPQEVNWGDLDWIAQA